MRAGIDVLWTNGGEDSPSKCRLGMNRYSGFRLYPDLLTEARW